jgi:magnesium-transporting ATPase (P-type)
MCKGADSIIQKRLKDNEYTQDLLKHTEQHLEDYAKTGLRTLLLAEKEISEIEYQQWRDEYR